MSGKNEHLSTGKRANWSGEAEKWFLGDDISSKSDMQTDTDAFDHDMAVDL